MTRGRFLQLMLGTYVIAAAVALAWLVFGPDTPWRLLDALIADLLATVVVFAVSRAIRNSSAYDLYWSVIPPLLLLWWWVDREDDASPLRAALLGTVVLLWAVRLTMHWALHFPGPPHEDWRYPMLRDRAPAFALLIDLFAIHVFPTLQVFAALIPAYVALSVGTRDVGLIDGLALVVGVGAVWLEWQADRELLAFARDREPGQILDTGLWGWSRHPNYFGEFCVWLSVLLFGIAAAPEHWWWQPLGLVTMAGMFLGASIPMMEERSLARRPGYQDVIDSVSKFVPRPQRTTR